MNERAANSEARAWTDFDDDGDLDLFVSDLIVPPLSFRRSVLDRNDGNGVFTRVTDSGLSDRREDTSGACWADYNNDGFADLFLARPRSVPGIDDSTSCSFVQACTRTAFTSAGSTSRAATAVGACSACATARTTLLGILPALEKFGAKLLACCGVSRLEADASRVQRVRCEWNGRQLSIPARVVVLAAGALMTPILLLASTSAHWPDGLANRSGLVGRNLMLHASDYVRALPDSSAPNGMRFEYRYPAELRARSRTFRERLRQALGRGRVVNLTGDNNLNWGHARGTCRFGDVPASSVLHASNRAHDVDNLYVADASFSPSSGGTNPSLTSRRARCAWPRSSTAGSARSLWRRGRARLRG